MPGSNSYARIVADGQRLLAAITKNADQLATAEPLRGRLEQALNQFKDLGVDRDNLTAQKQVLSRRIAEVAQQIADVSIDVKAQVKATLGSRSEQLIEFQVSPRRKVLRTDPKSRSVSTTKRKATALATPVPPSPSENTPAA